MKRTAFALALLLAAAAAAAQTHGIQVLVHGVHDKEGGVVYRYQVKNGSPSAIDHVVIGLPGERKALPANLWKMNPLLTDIPAQVPATQCKPFDEMVCEVALYNLPGADEPRASVVMRGAELFGPVADGFAHKEFIKAGASSSYAEIRVPARDAGYLAAAAEVGLFDNRPRDENGQLVRQVELALVKADTSAPQLQGSTAVQKRGVLLDVQVELKVTDDVDPRPEVALVAVSANQKLRPGDVVAQLNADTRRVQLRASKGRVYALTYRAVDASDNVGTLVIEVPAEP